MRLELFDRYRGLEGPLQRVDERVKIVAALVFVAAVVATPLGAWRFLAAEGLLLAFALGLSGIDPRDLWGRWLGFLVLIGFLAVMVALAHPLRATLGAGPVALAIVAKNGLAFAAMLVLANTSSMPRLLGALRSLGAPAVLVATLLFMYRYLFVFTDELERMLMARRARSFRRSGRLGWELLTSSIGVLFLRAFERGERVHAAMLARGWDGTTRTLDGVDGP